MIDPATGLEVSDTNGSDPRLVKKILLAKIEAFYAIHPKDVHSAGKQ